MSNFIIESAILQEAQNFKMIKPNKARYRMIVQTIDEENMNHRIYPGQVLIEGLKKLKDKIEKRSWLGEYNHPLPTGNQQFDAVRQSQVDLERVSHVITGYEVRGKQIVAEIETTMNHYGQELLSLLKDKITIGKSLRAMAEVERNPRTGLQTVKAPIHVITYDTVSSPSHTAAVVNFNEMTFESRMICEQESGLVCIGNRCYTANYFDKLIETEQIRFFERWV